MFQLSVARHVIRLYYKCPLTFCINHSSKSWTFSKVLYEIVVAQKWKSILDLSQWLSLGNLYSTVESAHTAVHLVWNIGKLGIVGSSIMVHSEWCHHCWFIYFCENKGTKVKVYRKNRILCWIEIFYRPENIFSQVICTMSSAWIEKLRISYERVW